MRNRGSSAGGRCRLTLRAGLCAAAVVALASVAGCDRSADEPRGEPEGAQGRWDQTPQLRTGRQRRLSNFRVFTLGRRIVIVAGSTHTGTRMTTATFDRAARRWLGLTQAPLRWRERYSAASTGKEVLVWGGTGNVTRAFANGARFDPVRKRWRRLPRASLSARFSHSAVWTGTRMLVWGGLGADGRRFSDGASFDPRSASWEYVRRAPISGSAHQSAVWTGETMLIVSRGRSATYAPNSNRWMRLPPLPERRPSLLFWTGREALAWNGQRVMRMKPETRAPRWRLGKRFPAVARGPETAVWAGGRLYVWGGIRRGCGDCYLRDGVAYDPRRDRWVRLPRSPLRGRYQHALASFGNGVFVWGGCCSGVDLLNDGATYAPR